MACARIINAAMIAVRAEQRCHFLAFDIANMRIAEACRHQFRMFLIVLEVARLMHGRDLAGHIFHVDIVLARKTEEMRLGLLRYVEESFRALQTILLFKIFRPCALTCAKLSAIAPGRSIAETSSLDQDDVSALFRQMMSCRQPSIAPADDDDIGLPSTIKFGILRTLRNTRLVP